MREFFIGLIFLAAVIILAGLGILVFPLVIVLGFFLRIVFVFLFLIFAIWLMGKFIIFIWDRFKS